MRAVILVAAFIAACTPALAPAESHQVSQPLQAPAIQLEAPEVDAPEVVSIRLLMDQHRQTIDVVVGRPFSVELKGEQPQGFSWMLLEKPAFIIPAPDGTAMLPATAETDDKPLVAGTGAVQTFFFVATMAGSGDLMLEHRRFDGTPPARDAFRVKIIAQ